MRHTLDAYRNQVAEHSRTLLAEKPLRPQAWLQYCTAIDELLYHDEAVSIPMSAAVLIQEFLSHIGQHPAIANLQNNKNFSKFSQDNEGFEGYLVYLVAHLNADSSITASGRTHAAIKVGPPVARRPPYRSLRAVFPHRALQGSG
jgi:hypothetical protein